MILAKTRYELQQNSQHGTYMLAQSENGERVEVFLPGAIVMDEDDAILWQGGKA